MKQLQKKGSVNEQTAENIVGFPQLAATVHTVSTHY